MPKHRASFSRLACVARAVVVMYFSTATAQPQYREGEAPTPTARADVRTLGPKDGGARYGQAIGASLVCPNIFVLPGTEALLKSYSGAELGAFKAEAQSVTLVWKKTLGCDAAADINRCRLLNDKSCSEAIKEIGTAGTVLPGLIEFRK